MAAVGKGTDENIIPDEVYRQAAKIIKSGGAVAFPTETFYGLAVNPFSNRALQRLFTIKKRPEEKPVLTLIKDRKQLPLLARVIPPEFEKLMESFWPGPLTLIFESVDGLPDLLTGNTSTVGVRISSHEIAARLVEIMGGPITATSANLSGRPPCVDADEVKKQLGTSVDLIIDGGVTRGGSGSTIVAKRAGKIHCIRDGVISFDNVLNEVKKAPG